MQVIMTLDLIITLVAAIIGLVYWRKTTPAWRFAIIAAILFFIASLSKNLAMYNIISSANWGLYLGGIPVIEVLYVCGAEFFLLLALFKGVQK